jgi:cyanocobalamin reductase (cyanide-eliminating) / alkylcobalamin dealkylase
MSRHGELVQRLRVAFAPWGFDLVQPLKVGWYNDGVEAALRLDDFGSSEHLAVIVGNSRALWPVWRSALARDPALGDSSDPLDIYTERAVEQVVAGIGEPVSLRFAHAAKSRRVAMQRLAHAAGLAYLTETHMSVHPSYGPWIALRAALSFAIPGPPGRAPVLSHPCGGCAQGCLPAFAQAVATLDGAPSEANLRANWRLWLACRDACLVGREHRYFDDQIRYHYLRESEPPSSGDPHLTDPAEPARAKR